MPVGALAVRRWLRGLAFSVLPLAGVVAVAAPASAHPLGNFTVNHYNGITVHGDSIDDLAIVDSAEIPTLQARQGRDMSSAGVRRSCLGVAEHVQLRVDDRPVAWRVTGGTFDLVAGAAGLPTSRLTCTLTASRAGGTRIALADRQDPDRIGWHEITAIGVGLGLTGSTVPERTISDELRHYPNDLLASPLDVRDASFSVGAAAGARSAGARGTGPVGFVVAQAGPATRALERLNGTVDRLIGVHRLTIGVVALAILLALVLGASHAMLPGHGKTVMAAYLAGRGGGVRDAVTVGATVTATHTAGVIVLGLVLSVSTRFAGENLLAWLGVVSGLLIVGVGGGLLRTAWRGRGIGLHGHGHSHGHGHGHGHGHSHGHGHGHSHSGHGHDHGQGHGGDEHDHHHHDHSPNHSPDQGPNHSPDHSPVPSARRRALIGMGVAGGLVPSPSALVVLLGAVALGRTALGVALVLSYGLGMAASLTAAGLLLVHLRNRVSSAGSAGRAGQGRFARTSGWLSRHLPLGTAALVLVVGLGLAWRSFPAVM
ncbi:hypothetical protein GCM10009839_77420 [Catenulispora yoronensis]|uniref:High-affinity nickel-transporter n=1 Tax=Catenulispora yoronensis TaxID=450799 RepID=A0ABN2VAV7_9ACTN